MQGRHPPGTGGCESSFIRTMTVGSGIRPDLLSLARQALAGSPAFASLPPVGSFTPP
ncbi:hypothetical protein DFP86_105192 [Paludibacterium purpuratum]|uniref:Uncharacterized protein n=1 Tax=Paludibacterium purpuratum TaxID=1144873 RepID=A0A4R7B6Q2_9NEIS|nr:hypothetical protein DFP86_105192 [Paludibacterium purpuratum]